MKHIFIVETSDDVFIPITKIAEIEAQLDASVEDSIERGKLCVTHAICNVPSAIRGVYRHFGADESLSPDQLGSAK